MPHIKKSLSILGVTGSIGRSTADVVLAHPDKFTVRSVTAQDNVQSLAQMAVALGAKTAIIGNVEREAELKTALEGTNIIVRGGRQALCETAIGGVDLTIAGMSGIAGLEPLLCAMKHSKAVAIANKEPLVAAGALVMAQAQEYGCKILPIDSEHNAVFQVFDFERPGGIARIILTASGGPFRTWTKAQMARATREEALKHPTWVMGQKISIDSATMMNKALEVIEAHVLFQMPAEKIKVLVHPQSVVHSMVEYVDGSFLAQMGASDMRTPIAYALGWPERIASAGQRLDLETLQTLTFEAPDFEKFPALPRAYECIAAGGAACLALNAANEVAVDSFLKNTLDFPGIMRIIDSALQEVPALRLDSLEAVIEADRIVRQNVLAHLALL